MIQKKVFKNYCYFKQTRLFFSCIINMTFKQMYLRKYSIINYAQNASKTLRRDIILFSLSHSHSFIHLFDGHATIYRKKFTNKKCYSSISSISHSNTNRILPHPNVWKFEIIVQKMFVCANHVQTITKIYTRND